MNKSAMVRREVFFSGMVQGVGFRYTTCRLAGRFRVAGFVQNLPDGRVRAVIEGPTGEVSQFLDAIESELGRYITEKEEATHTPLGEQASFDIRF